MDSNNENNRSESFDIIDSCNDIDKLTSNCNRFESFLLSNNLQSIYLYETISEPLYEALTYVIIHRPDDPIEFISKYLINWSCQKTRQNIIDQEENNILTSINMYHGQCQEAMENKRLLIERETKQEQQSTFQHEKDSFPAIQTDFPLKACKDNNEQERFNLFQDKWQTGNIQRIIHTHETSSGLDNQGETNANHICHDGYLLYFTYFSKLKDKLINCDKS